MKQEKAATLNRRKYDEDFKRSALKMIDNGQSVCSAFAAVWEYQKTSFINGSARLKE
jgi:hypothetical protein